MFTEAIAWMIKHLLKEWHLDIAQNKIVLLWKFVCRNFAFRKSHFA